MNSLLIVVIHHKSPKLLSFFPIFRVCRNSAIRDSTPIWLVVV
nr:MAG TPA: hypothetical protein [Caudoviricetes sp.]